MDRSGGNAGSDIGVQLACGPGEVHYSCIVQRVIDIDAQLGARIRVERKNRGWSLSELAERAAISRAMVAKVEAGQSSPTANLLGKLSGAFGLTISTLMSRAESGQGRLVRWADQPVWVDPESGYVRRQVSPASDMPFDLVHVTLPAGARGNAGFRLCFSPPGHLGARRRTHFRRRGSAACAAGWRLP